jgi:hypothetical protein
MKPEAIGDLRDMSLCQMMRVLRRRCKFCMRREAMLNGASAVERLVLRAGSTVVHSPGSYPDSGGHISPPLSPVFTETVRHSVRERVVTDSFPSQSRFAPRAPCVKGYELEGQPS